MPSRYEKKKFSRQREDIEKNTHEFTAEDRIGPSNQIKNKRDKRTKSYFEPIYDPSDDDDFPNRNWKVFEKSRNYHVTLSAKNFLSIIKSFEKEVVSEVSFCFCDFDGDFSASSPSFKGCEFDKCDFGLSIWSGARFKRCKFFRTSFSLASFIGCEFRDCTFVETGLSGNETILTGTIFTNPTEFINSAYLNKDSALLLKNKTTLEYQSMRLDGTKSSIARAIFANSTSAGSEKTYYEIAKFYQNQSNTSKISNARHQLSSKPSPNISLYLISVLVILVFEREMIRFIGTINNWGESVAKPAIIGLLIIFAFSLLYYTLEIKPTFWSSVEASIDISLLIGYTKHASLTSTPGERFAYVCNMLIGLIWYSVFVPTIIGRVSRIR